MTIAPTLLVTRKWPPAVGGMETWSVRMADELAKLGPVQVVALPGRADGRAPAAWRLLLFPFTVLVRFLTAKPRPATVHIGDMALWPLGMLLGAGRKVVISAHGTDVAYHRRGGFRGTLYGAYLRLGAKLFGKAHVVANSAATAAAASETGWSTAAVIPLATDFATSGPNATHDGSILFAGRLVARKGCGWFVREVLPLLPEGTPLRIAGTPWDASESWVLDDPRIEYLGALAPADLARAYASAMCVIVPNIEPRNGEFEGFGLVACEAAACGAVVLAARTGGLIEAVREGETGFLLRSGDSAAWANAIRGVAGWSAERRAAFTEHAARKARSHYAWPRVAATTAQLYGAAA